MKNKFKILLVVGILLVLTVGIIAISFTSTNYAGRTKSDFGAAGSNASSSSYSTRFSIGGHPVSQITSSNFGGRLGMFDDMEISNINMSILNLQEIVRGKDVSGEDDLGLISNSISFKSFVFVNRTNAGIPNINVSAYFNGTFVVSNETNSSGETTLIFTKSSQSVGIYNMTVNYTTVDYYPYYNSSTINFSLVAYQINETPGNKSTASNYENGQVAILFFNITKLNASGTSFYDPQNISVNATDSATTTHYPNNEFVSGKRIVKNAQGQYESHVAINKTIDDTIRWEIRISDDNFTSYIGSAIQADVGIVDGPVCGNGFISGAETCDDGNTANGDGCSSTCTTETTTTPPGGGTGGGGSLPPAPEEECPHPGAVESQCDGSSLATRTCGEDRTWDEWSSTPCLAGQSCDAGQCTDINCFTGWECGEWGQCFLGNLSDYESDSSGGFTGTSYGTGTGGGITGRVIGIGGFITGNVIDKFNDKFSPTGFAINEGYCELGETRCKSGKTNVVQQCSERERKRGTQLYWENVKVPKGMICANGVPTCNEKNSCDSEGARMCSNTNRFQVCEQDANGCLKWTSNQRCVKGEFCSEGECIEKRVDVCELGETTCINDNVFECVEKGRKVKYNDWKVSDRCFADICYESECYGNTCFNKVRDGIETGIDCGGDCISCDLVEPDCGNGVSEIGEQCDNGFGVNGIACVANYSESCEYCGVSCKNKIVQGASCGDGNVNLDAGEECDSVATDCVSCKIVPLINETITNETVMNETKTNATTSNETVINVIVKEVVTSNENEYTVGVGEEVEIELGVGDKLSVTYVNKDKNTVTLRTSPVETFKSDRNTRVKHKVRVDSVRDGVVVVTVSSQPQTKEILIGETVVFDLQEEPILSPSVSGEQLIQIRSCTNSICSLDTRVEARLCEVDFAPCEENWKCEYTVCTEDDYYSTPYDCVEVNSCGAGVHKPTDPITCKEREKMIEELEEELHCKIKYECDDWGSCRADYTFGEVLDDKALIIGVKERECSDSLNCAGDKTDKQACELKIDIEAKKVSWCSEDYIEIRERATKNLVGRMKQEKILGFVELSRVDVHFTVTEFGGICPYCSDGVQNYDEEGVDCGGPSCNKCLFFSPFTFWNWLPWAILMSWILFTMLSVTYWKLRDEEDKREFNEFISNGVDVIAEVLKPTTKEEAEEKERKISDWFRRISSRVTWPIGVVWRKPREARAIGMVDFPVKSEEERTLDRMKRKLHDWRRSGYYGTAVLESKIKGVEEKLRRKKHEERPRHVEVHTGSYKKKGKFLEYLKKLKLWKRRGYYGTEHLRESIKYYPGYHEGSHKLLELERRRRKYREKILKRAERKRKFSSFANKLKFWKKKGYYGTEKLGNGLGHNEGKAEKRIMKLMKKRDKIERRRQKGIINSKIKNLKKEKRKRTTANIMGRLGILKKQGYYGTEEIKSEIKRLKRQKKNI